MYNLKETIYSTYFAKLFHTSDPNKDSSNKGTMQRFVETLAEFLDETVISTIFGLLNSTLVPDTVKDKFIPYLEQQLGLEELIHPDLSVRRAILKALIEIYKTKGTLKSYKLLFNALGFDDIEIIDAGINFGFDSDVTLDDTVRRFDLGRCHKCRYYTLNLLGSVSIDSTMFEAIRRAIKLIEPVYANLYKLQVNSADLDLLNIFVNDNGDLVYTTINEQYIGFTLVNGDLLAQGSDSSNYTINDNGDLIHN